MVLSAFCGGLGRTSFKTSPRPKTSPADFARGEGAGSARKTAGDGAGEAFSAGRLSLFGGSLPAILSGVFAAGVAVGANSADSAGLTGADGWLVTEAEVEEGWLRKLKSFGMAKISPANTAAPSRTGTI